jgi:hypothetical protein
MSKKLPTKKRTAQVAGLGPPPQQPPPKKKKVEIEFDALTQLQQVLGPGGLIIGWKNYDPDCFMESMRRLGRKINALTPTTVGEYLTDGRLENDLVALDTQEMYLKEPIDPVKHKYLELAQANRARMIAYVARVRTCLNGQY